MFIAEQGYLILPFSNGPFLSPSKGYVLETVGMIVHSGAKYEIMRTNLDHSRGEDYSVSFSPPDLFILDLRSRQYRN